MNKTELRIGNYVLYGDKVHKITIITEYQVELDGFKYVRLSDTFLKPIILTEELLLSWGGHKLGHFTILDHTIFPLYWDRQLSICLQSGNKHIYIQEVDNAENPTKVEDLVCLYNADLHGDLYVHYFQNLYDMLMFKPLDINKEIFNKKWH